ncbi:hypothetical protein [Aurantibacter sp.]|uniref:hypothetical protein n=1 Tax=Aurantibacter sp. TaxID=2807103 RepID=UPI003262F8D3
MLYKKIKIVHLLLLCTMYTYAQVHEAATAQEATGISLNGKEAVGFKQEVEATRTRTLPFIDDRNFDSFIEPEDYNNVDVRALKLEKIYPDFYKEGYNYLAIASYKIPLSENFYSIVVTIKKGDHEMESILINYSLKGDIIDSQVIAYDEIAEGMSRIKSRISDHNIIVNRIFWSEKKEIEQDEYNIHLDGTIVALDTKNLSETVENFALIAMVIDQLGLKLLKIKTDLITSKELPHRPNEIVVVIPEIVNSAENYFELDSHVTLVHSITGKVTHKFFESSMTNEWVSDAIRLTEITIDTAPYMLVKDKRAFGIRVSYLGSSRPNPYLKKTISLFVKSGDALKKVLHNYNVMDYGGEWDTNCAGEFTEEKKILIISEKLTNGFFDIIAKSTITHSIDYIPEDGECESEKDVTRKKIWLKFDGETYK